MARRRSRSRPSSPRCPSASCSCPVLLLTGTARYLFTPLAMAVVFAMLASYLLSRTLVPTMMAYLLGSEVHLYSEARTASARRQGLLIWRPRPVQHGVRGAPLPLHGPARLVAAASRTRAGRVLVLLRRLARPGHGWSARISSPTSIPARCGCTRAARPARASKRPKLRFAAIEREIRSVIPPDEIDMLIDNIGIPNSWPSYRAGRHSHHLQRRRRDPDFARTRRSTAPRATTKCCCASGCARSSRTWSSSSSRPTSPARF